jgi:septal ring factor EnvC (AmiA/AmiB activator)
VQISKLETAIEAQKQKTDLLADIVKLHEQHLHQLDEMIEDIGKEIQALKVQSGLHFSIDRAIAQVISDTNKLRAVVPIFERVIHSAVDQKLAPGALNQQIPKLHSSTFRSVQTRNFLHSPP